MPFFTVNSIPQVILPTNFTEIAIPSMSIVNSQLHISYSDGCGEECLSEELSNPSPDEWLNAYGADPNWVMI